MNDVGIESQNKGLNAALLEPGWVDKKQRQVPQPWRVLNKSVLYVLVLNNLKSQKTRWQISDLQTPGLIIKIRIGRESGLYWPGSLKTQSHMHERMEWSEGREGNFLGFLDMGAQCSLIPKSVGKVLTGYTEIGRIWECRCWWIKAKIWMMFGMIEKSSCRMFVSPLPECIMGIDTVSDESHFSHLVL